MIGPALFNQTIVVYLMYLDGARGVVRADAAPAGACGVRAVGEHPRAADTVGIKVERTRYRALLIAGAIAGVGGAFYTVVSVSSFGKEMTAGAGFIALAAVIFGKWDPVRAALAALLFGFASNLEGALSIVGAPGAQPVHAHAPVRRDDPGGRRSRRTLAGPGRRRRAVHQGVTCSVTEVDWDALRAVATEAMAKAYVPYSKFPVGAAALVDDGRVVVGCNVENASYGVTLCAECSLVSALVMSGRRAAGRVHVRRRARQRAHAVRPVPPAAVGARRRPACCVETVSGIRPMTEVLPDAFGPADLTERAAGAVMSESFDAVDVIVAKRDGRRLTDAQIDWVVDAYTRGASRTSRCRPSTMAILLNGMDRAEIARWTAAMIASGERMSFARPEPPDRRQALDRRRGRQDHAAARAARRGVRRRGAAAVRPRARATPAARSTSSSRSPAGAPR